MLLILAFIHPSIHSSISSIHLFIFSSFHSPIHPSIFPFSHPLHLFQISKITFLLHIASNFFFALSRKHSTTSSYTFPLHGLPWATFTFFHSTDCTSPQRHADIHSRHGRESACVMHGVIFAVSAPDASIVGVSWRHPGCFMKFLG